MASSVAGLELAQRWAELRETNPRGVRIREAAALLEVSEALLLSTQLGGEDVVRLEPRIKELFERFEGLGEVMASTRNAHAVIEKHGPYVGVDVGDFVGLVLGEEIDLRLFPKAYHEVFYVQKMHRGKPLRSVQFFDAHGDSLHKVYLEDASKGAALDALVEAFRHEDQRSLAQCVPREAKVMAHRDEEIDAAALRADWLALQDTHDFFAMLRRHEVERRQGLRLAPERHAVPIASFGVVDELLWRSSERSLPIMIFVGNAGCIEIHTGPINKIVETGSWINVMDPRFNLHLDRSGIDQIWLVRKPTSDGVVTSLELFDAKGEVIAMFFGERKPGKPELPQWRELIEELTGAPPLD